MITQLISSIVSEHEETTGHPIKPRRPCYQQHADDNKARRLGNYAPFSGRRERTDGAGGGAAAAALDVPSFTSAAAAAFSDA